MSENFIAKFFPPPKYIAMPAIGVDISDLSLKYFALRETENGIRPWLFGMKKIDAGIVESGEIKRKDLLIELLKSVRKETGEKYVVASLPEEKGFLSRIKLPAMKRADIREAVELQLEEHVPLPPKEVIFDFDIIKESLGKSGGRIDVNLAAFPKSLIKSYSYVFEMSGFKPVAFEMETQAIKRAVFPKKGAETSMIVDFGKTRTTFLIISDSKVQFTSTIKVAGEDIDSALAKNLSVGAVEAEKIKKERGFIKSGENEEVFNAILPVVSAILEETIKLTAYWSSHFDQRGKNADKIEKIILCGGDSNLFGLPQYLSSELKLPVEIANPWRNVASFEDYIPEIELRESLMYTIALGLALRAV